MKIEITINTPTPEYLTTNQVNDIKEYIDNHISGLEFGNGMNTAKYDSLKKRFKDGVIVGATSYPLSGVEVSIKIG
jgi:hypothetical protein